MIGWHFVGENLRGGNPVPADGEWLVHDGPVVPCKSGLHASEHAFDAMMYAPGATLCRVELDGDLVAHGKPGDKWAGRRRRIIARRDATAMLRRFACDMALSVADLWDMPDVVRQYLVTADESQRAAASDATRAAARDAAWGSAWDAACDAACDAAWAAARDSAWDAAWYAAWASAKSAAWSAHRAEFARRVDILFREGEP